MTDFAAVEGSPRVASEWRTNAAGCTYRVDLAERCWAFGVCEKADETGRPRWWWQERNGPGDWAETKEEAMAASDAWARETGWEL